VDGREQDVNVAALDFLKRAGMQAGFFGETFLGQVLVRPLTSDAAAEFFNRSFFSGSFSHASLGRELARNDHALLGRIVLDGSGL